MLLVRKPAPNFDGSVRCGKRLLYATLNNGMWEVCPEDPDMTAACLSAGFVKPESPLAAKEKAAPAPAVDVVVGEKAEKPKEEAPAKK